ncbi:tRNA lysidine(34) synthetase TilS [Lactiplantibacillus plajomi]|uniref:tRNA(Ile)-lysidine synthase n=1 Tax=Lactiplantibacillus plajomi TaxID=1457217 RepID=A0ABV6K5V9_9LACO
MQQFNRQLAAAGLLDPTKTVVVAISTGVDSMVLLTLLQRLPTQQRPQLVVAHVNHQLRAESDAEAAYLQRYCDDHDLTLRVTRWPQAQHPQTGVEAAGRKFRYQFFADVMRASGAVALLTAHHANDQAETFLMKLARGGDLAQLTGIAGQRPFTVGQLVRPLLTWPKAALYAYADRQRVRFFEDATNQDVSFTRNRIRHRVVPELTTVNPEFLGHVAGYERQLATLLAAQKQMVAQLLPTVLTSNTKLQLQAWAALPTLWQAPVFREWLQQRTGQLYSLAKLAPWQRWLVNTNQPTGRRQLDADFDLVKTVDMIDVSPHKKRVKKLMPAEKIMVDLNQWQKITAGQTVGVFASPPGFAAQPFRLAANDWPLSWRPWQPDDRVTLRGGGHQSVRRILINHKVPRAARHQVMVLVNATGDVLWVVGHKFTYRKREFGTQTVFLASKPRELKGVHLKR